MIRYLKRTIKDSKIGELKKFETGCWIDVSAPTEEEISYLEERFTIDKQNLLDGLDDNELPRVEFKDKAYIYIKFIESTINYNLKTLLIVLGQNFVLTLSSKEAEIIKNIQGKNEEIITTQRLKFLIKLFLKNSEEFEKITLQIVKRINSERDLFENLTENKINNLLTYENVLNNFVSSYYYSNLIYKKIIKKLNFYDKDKDIVEDLINESEQGFDLCKSTLKSISNMRNNLVIMLSNRLNKTISTLTILTVIITIPAAISGIYGMNLRLPLQQNPFAFFYILGFIIVSWTLFFVYFKARRII